MTKGTRIALLTGYASLLTLFLGFFSAQDNAGQAKLLSHQVEFSGEYVDFILTKRLSAVGPADEELLLAKEDLIHNLQEKSTEMIRHSKWRGWGVLGLTISLILLQIKIMEETAADETGLSRGMRALSQILYYGAISLGMLSIFWSLLVSFL